MCYTPQASVYAFIIGMVSSSYLLKSDSPDLKVIGGFFLFVSFMQLFDYIFWTTKDDDINRLFTKIACIFNNLQPIVLAFIIYKYKGSVKGKYLVYIYTLFIFLYTNNNWKSLDKTTSDKTMNGSLYWAWNNWKHAGIVYGLFLITITYLSYYNLSVPYNKMLGVFLPFFFFMSYFKYGASHLGRFWCYFAPYAPLIFLFLHPHTSTI
uniref:Uncharacterized protein n=1 Tax=viral metagenome TaxID=1070528 RepID=A0A6C0DN07_9ZZZZ